MAMADTKQAPLLTLDTLVDRRTVVIDGTPYDLLNAGEMSILDYHRIGKMGAKVEEMMNADDLDEAQVVILKKTLDALCRALLVAPDEVHVKLSDNHRLAVVGVFTDLDRELMEPATRDAVAPSTPTGESKSQD